jgi:hypothetical protein
VEQAEANRQTAEVAEQNAAAAGFDDAHAKAAAALAQAIASLEQARATLLTRLGPTDDATALIGMTPIALLPLRIETRFAPKDELWVRVFPDDVHADTHEPGLTVAERSWGEHFWTSTWSAATDDDRIAAWQQLAAQIGPRRAAWIARTLTPTNAAQIGQPETTPAFPPTNARPAPWSRAPRTQTLPDRWLVLGYTASQRTLLAAGSQIPDPLPTGPDPAANFTTASPEDPPVDDDVRWRVDFDAAVKVGMGLRIQLTPEQAKQGFDRLIVLGVKPTLTSKSAGLRLRDALDAHHYTDGVSLLAPGTPTNATDDARPPTTQATGDDADGGYATERSAALATLAPGSDGALLVGALGVPPNALIHVSGADATERKLAQQMDTVLWPATWGYYLQQLLAPLITDPTRAALRRHALDRVRARGPLPVLRTGRQPYGVLPVTSLQQWTALGEASVVTPLVTVLRALIPLWLKAGGVPRVTAGADPDSTLIGILELSEHAQTIRARPTTSRDYERNVALLFGEDVAPVDAQWTAIAQNTLKALASAGIGGTPWLTQLALENPPATLDGPLIEGDPAQAQYAAGHYLPFLAAQPPQSLWHNLQDAKLVPLLYLLARHSLLRAWLDAGDDAAATPASQRAEHVFSGYPGADPSPWDRFATNTALIAQVASAASTATSGPAAELGELLAAMRELAGIEPDRLELLLREGLGLSAQRLDAWVTSVALARLDVLRDGQVKSGIHLGGWGWLENVRPDVNRSEVTPPDGVPAPVWNDPDNAGHVHAPSLGHAATAAVLRSGYLTHAASSDDAFAVDLSSERARRALELLDGVREGQPPGALLGYRFERDLHERRGALALDQYVAPLRAAFPLVAGKRVAETAPTETIQAANVVDGLALLRGRGSIGWGQDGLPAAGSAEQQGIDSALDDLAAVADAVDDLALAESVHQAVQGNPQRAAATMDALSRGEAPPPQFEVVATPRTGTGLTHRLLVMFSGAAPAQAAGWTAPAPPGPDVLSGPRATLDPYLEAWAESLLPDPRQVRFGAVVSDTDGTQLTTRTGVTLDTVGLAALDVIAAAAPDDEPADSTLERLIAYRVARTTNGLPAGAHVRVTLTFDPGAGATGWTLPGLMQAATQARALLTGARQLLTRDLAPAGHSTDVGDVLDLQARADAAESWLRDADRRLAAAGRPPRPFGPPRFPPPLTAEQQRTALLAAAAIGVPGTAPVEPVGDDSAIRAALRTQAISARKETQRRLAAHDAVKAAESGATTADAQLRLARDRLRALFGAEPPFTLAASAPDPTELGAALSASTTVQGGDELAADGLLLDVAAVRSGTGRLADALLQRAALNPAGAGGADLQVAQLPHDPAVQWIGLPLNGNSPAPNRLSLLVHAPAAIDATAALHGLVADEWVETIPSASETTGVAFNYSAPSAEAPQSILLVLPAAQQTTWSLAAIEAIVLETCDLVALRGVDVDALSTTAGQLLPAAWLARDTESLTVSTDPAHAVRALWPAPPPP